MDFFDRQANAQKQTRRLVWLFGLNVLAVLGVANLLLCPLVVCFTQPVSDRLPGWSPFNFLATGCYYLGEALEHPGHFASLVYHWPLMLGVTLGTLAAIMAGSYYKLWRLSAGGPAVAEQLGGRRVSPGTNDPDEQRLRNVVEEMAIASCLPVPEIYVLDCERGINAFAAGHTHHDVAICVTRGCLQLLSRGELQGVIAHEFSHVLNGDTRLNMRLIGLAHGLFWPTLLGRMLIIGHDAPSSPEHPTPDGEPKVVWLPTAPLGLLLVVLGGFSLPFVRLLKSAICRQREWLADAAAVQFTRDPEGIAGALKKVGGLSKHGRLDTPHAELASHLYVVSCHGNPWLPVLATHPPLKQRIAVIDPRFDGSFPPVAMLAPNEAEREATIDRLIGQALVTGRGLYDAARLAAKPGADDQIGRVCGIRFALPAEVKNALRTPAGAAGVVYSLLLSDDESTRARQLEILRTKLEPSAFEQFNRLFPLVGTLDDKFKLPLAEFAVPALREHDSDEHQAFGEIQQQLVDCNDSLDLFEYALVKMAGRQLQSHFDGPAAPPLQYGTPRQVLPECAVLLSALAHVGSEDEAAARAAFAAGVEYLDAPGAEVRFLTRQEWDLAGVDAALVTLAGFHGPLRRNVLMACGHTVTADGQVTVREAELLRAIADSLDCPMPPFVEAIRDAALAGAA